MARLAVPSSPDPRVSVVIVAAKQPTLLARCLQSLANDRTTVPFETIVVLNNARPDVQRLVCEDVSGVTLVTSPVSLGLAGAANRGRAHARGEFVLLLHDDTEVEAGWLDALVAVADAHPEAGAVGSRTLNLDGTPQNLGAVLWRDGTASGLRGELEVMGRGASIRAVDYCGTASLLVRTSTWDAIGGADEQLYPAYYVDVDLCLGTWHLPQAVLCTPDSVVRHYRGASTERPFRHFLLLHNRGKLLEKWGDRLEAFEPRPRDVAAGVQRAIERAQARWRQIPQKPCARGATGPPAPFDAAAQERRVLEIAVRLERAWAEELSAQLGRAIAERDAALAARTSNPAIRRIVRAARSLLSRAVRRVRRPMATVVRRFSRRGAASRTG